MKRLLKYLWLSLLLIVSSGRSIAEAPTPVWPAYGYDAQRTQRSHLSGPLAPKELWTFPIEAGRIINFSPTLDSDGTIYIATWGDDGLNQFFQGRLYAVNPDGTLKWFFDPPAPEQHSEGKCCIWGTIEASVAMGADGTLYFGRGDYKLYALNPEDGSLYWEFRTYPEGFPEKGGQIIASPVIGQDGTIYFGTWPNFFPQEDVPPALFAVNPNGSEKWRYNVGGVILGAPALGADGTIYFGDRDRTFHAVADKGDSYEVKWTFTSVFRVGPG